MTSLRRKLGRFDRSRHPDRGSVVVEMAIVAPFLILLFVGMAELGMAWRSSNKVTNSLRAGARAAAALPENTLADFALLQTVTAGLGDLNADVVRVIVYKSDTVDGAVPPACLNLSNGGVNGVCNVYDTTVLHNLDQTQFDYAGPNCGPEWDRFWCPTGRSSSPTATYLGVYLEVQHQYFTGMLPGSGILISDRTISRIEPKLS